MVIPEDIKFTDIDKFDPKELHEMELKEQLIREHKMKTLKLALYLGELLTKNGAETYRVEDSVVRVCRSMGYFHVNVFVTPTAVIISDEKFDGLCFLKTISYRSIDLNKVSMLNDFSRSFVSRENKDTEAAMLELKEIDKLDPYKPLTIYLVSGIASAFFSGMIGGNQLSTFICTFLTAMLASWVYNKTYRASAIPAFSAVLAGFAIAFCGVWLKYFDVIDDPTVLIVGAIMPLLPGVAFTKSIRDLISGNLISGIARFFDAMVTLLSLASGVALVIDMFFRFGGGF